MKLNRAVVLVGLLLVVLVSAPRAFATPLTAHLTVNALGFLPGQPPPFTGLLDGIITLEAASGPFWWQSLQTYLPVQNGYLITSFAGTFNGKPADLLFNEPLRPAWMVQTGPDFFLLGYMRFQSEGIQYGSYPDTASIVNLIIVSPTTFAPASGTATLVPEFPSIALMGAGLALFGFWVRKTRRLPARLED